MFGESVLAPWNERACANVVTRLLSLRLLMPFVSTEPKVVHMKYAVGVGVALLVVSTAASAASGNTVAGTDMYAGPSGEFPQGMHLAADLKIKIHGCLRQGRWCDVSWRGNRGWVPAAALAYRDGDARVAIARAPRGEVPTVAFNLHQYWDQNYRDRLWYEERAKWESRQSASAAAP
jgi:uncharacterized protein YraI